MSDRHHFADAPGENTLPFRPSQLDRIELKLDAVLKQLDAILKLGVKLMSAVTDLEAAVTKMDSAEASAEAVITGLAQQILANLNDPAALKSLADDLTTRSGTLAAAVVAGTDALNQAQGGGTTPPAGT